MEAVLFYLLAAAAVASALLAITRVSPLVTALWLAACFVSAGGLMGLLGAPLVALFHILLAAGAIIVLFVFVIMLADLRPSALEARTVRFGKVLGAFIAVYLAAVMGLVVMRPPFGAAPPAPAGIGGAREIGRALVGEFAVPFELISTLLVVAMVGAVVMGKRRIEASPRTER